LVVIEDILRAAREPLTTNEILARAGERLPTKSRAPRNIIARDLALDIRDNRASKFARVAPGTFTLKELIDG
jgi:hypothetical protein